MDDLSDIRQLAHTCSVDEANALLSKKWTLLAIHVCEELRPSFILGLRADDYDESESN